MRGPKWKDHRGVPFRRRCRWMGEHWSDVRPHVRCIQDVPGVQLYTEVGYVEKPGGVTLTRYRCARGSETLQAFHLHLNKFIPGELIGVDLLSETGEPLQMLPDTEETNTKLEAVDVEDEEEEEDGFEETLSYMTVSGVLDDQVLSQLSRAHTEPPTPPSSLQPAAFSMTAPSHHSVTSQPVASPLAVSSRPVAFYSSSSSSMAGSHSSQDEDESVRVPVVEQMDILDEYDLVDMKIEESSLSLTDQQPLNPPEPHPGPAHDNPMVSCSTLVDQAQETGARSIATPADVKPPGPPDQPWSSSYVGQPPPAALGPAQLPQLVVASSTVDQPRQPLASSTVDQLPQVVASRTVDQLPQLVASSTVDQLPQLGASSTVDQLPQQMHRPTSAAVRPPFPNQAKPLAAAPQPVSAAPQMVMFGPVSLKQLPPSCLDLSLGTQTFPPLPLHLVPVLMLARCRTTLARNVGSLERCPQDTARTRGKCTAPR
ncbi:NAC-alpha domain-containing protein 1-like [Engraulis encrasicolus]|uniref:NAC-alpha domain-containing protein 1-like n=1 Tax=Engraulis encrasicolus TaxID=184585 RepID=UPI002FD45E3F